MLKFFRRLSGPGVNEVEVKPARRENVLNTVSHVAQRDVAALGLPAQSSCKVPDEAEILEKTVDLQPGEKQTVVGRVDDQQGSDEEELARDTAAMSITSDCDSKSKCTPKPVANKRKHPVPDSSLSSSSDDEVVEILRGCTWATVSSSERSKLPDISKHSACKSRNKKQRRQVRPFLDFDKVRQSRLPIGFRRVLNQRKDHRVCSLQFGGLGTSRRRVIPLVLGAPRDEPGLTFPVIPQSGNQMEIASRCY